MVLPTRRTVPFKPIQPAKRAAYSAVRILTVWAEAPVHDDDVMTRLASAYGDQRVGPHIARQLESALATAERRGVILRRGGFVYLPNGAVQIRSRAGTGIPAERIAPEEYQEIVLGLPVGAHGPGSARR